MDDMKPHPLSPAEWKEIMAVPTVRDAWGVERDTTPDEFSSWVYAVKFKFVSGSPGYVGDLFILQGDALTGDAPFVLRRGDKGELIVL
jgi:hypothetical protein